MHSYLFIAVRDIPDLVPREGDFRGQPVVWVINVKTQGVDSKEQFGALFILREERAENPFIPLGGSDMNYRYIHQAALSIDPPGLTQELHWQENATHNLHSP